MPPEIRKRPASGPRKPAEQRDITLYALLSLGSFLAGLPLLWLLVAKAEMLVRLGLEGKLYYLVLLTFGLTVGVFLFGILPSFAPILRAGVPGSNDVVVVLPRAMR